jgi:hypothetical protein
MTFRLRCASAGDHDSCRDGNQDGEHLKPTTASTSCFSTCQRFNRSGRRPPGATGFRHGGARCRPRAGRSGAPPGHWSFSSRVTRVRAAGMSGVQAHPRPDRGQPARRRRHRHRLVRRAAPTGSPHLRWRPSRGEAKDIGAKYWLSFGRITLNPKVRTMCYAQTCPHALHGF